MFKLILLFFLATTVHGRRIMGGTDTSIEDHPYQVSLELYENHSCGGSILLPTKVLTAAHCTISFQLNTLRVRVGSSWREEGGQLINLSKKTEHPQYDNVNYNNDIAVVILELPLVFDSYVQPIQISEITDMSPGSCATITGWGVTESGERAKRLQMLQVPKVGDTFCKNIFPKNYNTTTMICYGAEHGRSICSSDSGGPLVIGGKQIGIVSYGPVACSSDYPEVYVKVAFFRDFVDSNN